MQGVLDVNLNNYELLQIYKKIILNILIKFIFLI